MKDLNENMKESKMSMIMEMGIHRKRKGASGRGEGGRRSNGGRWAMRRRSSNWRTEEGGGRDE